MIKGDQNGSYELTADFTGTLMPFMKKVSAHFAAEAEIEVKGGEGIVIYLMPEDAAYMDETYYVNYRIVNESDRTFYNLTTSIGAGNKRTADTYIIPEQKDGETGETEGVLLQAGDSVQFCQFAPGDSYEGVLEMPFLAEGDPETEYYRMIDSMVEVTQGENLGVIVKVVPISAHIQKVIHKEIVIPSFFGDPVDLSSGAFTEEIDTFTVYGETNFH